MRISQVGHSQVPFLDMIPRTLVHEHTFDPSKKRIKGIERNEGVVRNKGIETNIDWYYDKDDELLKEAGLDLSELVGLKFNLIVT